jgi:TRAP-type C4-dicarboxylate transport system substrate-binding protein
LFAALCAVLALSSTAPAADAPLKLKIATLAPEGSAWMRAFNAMREEIVQATGGQVQFKAYPGGVLGEEKDVLYKIKVGQVDGAGFMGFGVSRVCPDAEAMGQLMAFRSYEEVDAAFESLRPRLEAQCRANGYLALGWTEVGFSYLYSVAPVRTIEELRAAKPWVLPGGGLIAEFFSEAGISGIPIPIGDVLTALQTGLIKTVFSPPLAAVATQWFTRIKYRTDAKLLYSMGGLFVSEKSWSRIPEAHRAAILKIADRQMTQLKLSVRKSDAEALDVMAKNGITSVTPPPEALAEFQRIGGNVTKRMQGKTFSPEAHEIVTRRVAEMRQQPQAAAATP